MISNKAVLLCQEVGGMTPLPPPLVSYLHYLQHYSNYSILFIFLCKYNCKIYHKNKSNGNYTKLTNKQKNHRK